MDSAWQDQEGLGRPLVSDAEVARFVADRFGLPIAGIKPLAGERDLNFLATAADGRRYVVKVANANEAREQLEWEQAAMRHVAEAREGGALALQTQAPVALADGSGGTVARLAGSSAQGGGAGAAGAAPAQYYVRVLTYLEGAMWSASDLAVDFLASLGRAAAALDAALEGFGRPASGAGPAPTHAWDLGACQATVRGYLADIDAEADRALLLRFCALHEAVVAPLQARGQLPRSVVHQDLNDNNVVCAEGRVVGVIDFGDMCETETVNNLAVALAYAFFGRPDPLAVVSMLVSGYTRVRALAAAELRCLFPLACMRVCTTVVMAAHSVKLDPANAAYLTISQAPAWAALRVLRDVDPQRAAATALEAAGLPSDAAA